jgi:hypothetical protein
MAKSVKKVKAKKKPRIKAKAKAKPDKMVLINFKVTSKDGLALKARARKFRAKSLSSWLRHAGLRYVSSKNAFIE